MRFFDNNTKNPDAYYEPNSFNGPKEDNRFAEPPLPLHGDAHRYDHRDGEIRRRQVALFAKCDPVYGAGVAMALKLDLAGGERHVEDVGPPPGGSIEIDSAHCRM